MSYRRDSTVWEERQVGQHRGSSYAWFVQPSSRTASPLDGSFSFFLKLLGSPSYNLGVSCITLKYLPCVSKCIPQGVYLACLTRSLSTCLLPLVAATFSSACLSRCTIDYPTGWSFHKQWGVYSIFRASWYRYRAVHCLVLHRPLMAVQSPILSFKSNTCLNPMHPIHHSPLWNTF